jgi:choline dehydrogenase-like flavoprotein
VTTQMDAGGEERIAITYHTRPEFIARIKRFRELMKEAFAPLKVRFTAASGEMNFGHPMGTCRMGDSPAYSVVDARGRVWDQDGLYIADASVFASALGINPALTTAAHAIRVAQAISQGER